MALNRASTALDPSPCRTVIVPAFPRSRTPQTALCEFPYNGSRTMCEIVNRAPSDVARWFYAARLISLQRKSEHPAHVGSPRPNPHPTHARSCWGSGTGRGGARSWRGSKRAAWLPGGRFNHGDFLHRAVAAKVGSKLTLMDAIEHDEEIMVVVLWYGKETEGLRWPEYVLPLASVRHRSSTNPLTLIGTF